MRAAGAGPAPYPRVARREPSLRRAANVSEVPIKKAGSGIEEKLHTWPFLVRNEFLMSLLVIAVLTIWSLTINAPLEEPSNPTRTPNPSKAPWYFLGLQEMLVFFDPWYAGVVLPSFIIVGLMLVPYLDINPKGNGYYTFRERTFEILTFFFGFHILWVSFIIIGTFFRGPGWNWFWPGQIWDPHLVEALTNVDLPYLFGFRDYFMSAMFGLVVIGAYFVVGYVGFLLVDQAQTRGRSMVGVSRRGQRGPRGMGTGALRDHRILVHRDDRRGGEDGAAPRVQHQVHPRDAVDKYLRQTSECSSWPKFSRRSAVSTCCSRCTSASPSRTGWGVSSRSPASEFSMFMVGVAIERYFGEQL